LVGRIFAESGGICKDICAMAVALYPNRDDLFRNYPELEPDDVQQALAFIPEMPSVTLPSSPSSPQAGSDRTSRRGGTVIWIACD
jgi:hypothetical protein